MCLRPARAQPSTCKTSVMKAFAYYRLPYLHHATYVAQHRGEPEVLASVGQLDGKEGFVIAPFAPSAQWPVVLIHPDETRLLSTAEPILSVSAEGVGRASSPAGEAMSCLDGDEAIVDAEAVADDEVERAAYAADFDCFHERLLAGDFRKIVLARRSLLEGRLPIAWHGGEMDAQSQEVLRGLFVRACRLYPRLFVALVFTPQSGPWLMATPEVLLQGEAAQMTTMSLAGTQRAEPSRRVADYPVEGVEWSAKNREEQQYVTSYIEQCVRGFTPHYSLRGPYTTMAANLYHLRTDIRFRLPDALHLGQVLERLYPTPAVCGIPKDATRQFILAHEHRPRQYYSGFVGPLSPSGKTHLYVSLRCMNIRPDGSCHLYAGGGLLRESEMEKEWRETQAKMQTILALFTSLADK